MSSIIISTSNRGKSISNYFFALAEGLVQRNHQVYLIVDGNRQNIAKMNKNPVILSWPSKRPKKWKDAKFFSDLLKKISPPPHHAHVFSVYEKFPLETKY